MYSRTFLLTQMGGERLKVPSFSYAPHKIVRSDHPIFLFYAYKKKRCYPPEAQ